MSLATITVPANYAYVLLAASAFPLLNIYQSYRVGRARKAAGVPYPEVYAEKAVAATSIDAMRFNCTQRAHLNTLESAPQVILATFLTGLKYPILSASLAAVWVFGRVLYTQGYSTGEPQKRHRGTVFFYPITYVLTGTAIWTAIDLVRAIL
ncbi:hypothetical protein BOTBODRAFT_191497 [Botryobasidium botryosum FD-172 SS1]|uniref:Membrane-associated proteins in eicosanoid and glutathione metabolism n=1 Tax=Botryobasidium botryosum (strain FD-172 SS1) TaxID=930990 RepID=A0A067LZL0_BOTB1|nr:hypothetical protein BOTBODRAFT_191497 [Botryobasidium botryosum FD-172 SS1]